MKNFNKIKNALQNFRDYHLSYINAKKEYENVQQNIYQTLTESENGDSSIINSIFTDFLEFSNEKDKPTFQVQPKIYDEWKEKRFGSNFQLSVIHFKQVYKPLYQYPKLHFLASFGFIRAKHIRQWSKIEPHLPQDLNEIQSAEDITTLLKTLQEKNVDNDGEENMEQIIAEKDQKIAELEERLHLLSPNQMPNSKNRNTLPPYQRERKANKSGYIYIMSLPCSSWKDDKGNQLFKLGETEEEDEKKVYEYFKNKYMNPTVKPDVKLLIKVENPHNLEQQILTIMQEEQCIFNAVNTTTSEFFSEKNLLKVLDIIKKRENSVWEYKKEWSMEKTKDIDRYDCCMKKYFEDGQQIRPINDRDKIGTYNFSQNLIMYNNKSYKSLTAFVKDVIGLPSVNGWIKCEYLKDGQWIKTKDIDRY